jgi:hypothetical protein
MTWVELLGYTLSLVMLLLMAYWLYGDNIVPRRCKKCGSFTMKKICPNCGSDHG